MSRTRYRTSAVVRAAGVLLLAPLLAACTDPPADGLTGTAAFLDDTGRGERPIDEGWIIAVPAAAVDDLWRAGGNKPIDQQNLPYISAQLNREQVTQAGGVIAPSTMTASSSYPPRKANTSSAISNRPISGAATRNATCSACGPIRLGPGAPRGR